MGSNMSINALIIRRLQTFSDCNTVKWPIGTNIQVFPALLSVREILSNSDYMLGLFTTPCVPALALTDIVS